MHFIISYEARNEVGTILVWGFLIDSCGYKTRIIISVICCWKQWSKPRGLHKSVQLHILHACLTFFICWNLEKAQLYHALLIIIGIQPLGRSGQRPEFSQATGMALVRCILGKFLGVACHCFPTLFRCSHFSPPGASTSATTWEIPAEEVGTVGENVVR